MNVRPCFCSALFLFGPVFVRPCISTNKCKKIGIQFELCKWKGVMSHQCQHYLPCLEGLNLEEQGHSRKPSLIGDYLAVPSDWFESRGSLSQHCGGVRFNYISCYYLVSEQRFS